MKGSRYGQRAGLMLVIAVGCRLGSMLLSTIRVEVGQQVTLGHVIASGAAFALALVAVPFFVLALVYGVLHLVRPRRSSGEDAPGPPPGSDQK